jgi:hypothetical protein
MYSFRMTLRINFISLNNMDRLDFIIEMQYVFCEIGIESVRINGELITLALRP